jgi:hypothetical protein
VTDCEGLEPGQNVGNAAAQPFDADVLERLARAYHARYRSALGVGDRDADTADRPWDELPEPLREANRASARAVAEHLTALGLTARPAPPGRRPHVIELDHARVEAGARNEHDRWARHTRAQGYVHGPERDDGADPPTHPDLVSWTELDEPTRDKDRARIRELPDLLAEVGYELEEARA